MKVHINTRSTPAPPPQNDMTQLQHRGWAPSLDDLVRQRLEGSGQRPASGELTIYSRLVGLGVRGRAGGRLEEAEKRRTVGAGAE